MRVYHLNCGTMRPFACRPLYGTGGFIRPGRVVVHCLLIEVDREVVLVDTGMGLGDRTQPSPPMRFFRWELRCPQDLEEAAVRQVTRLGYQPADVRHIIQTHLHLDHAGGLPDFPHAKVHLYAREHAAAMRRESPVARFGYRPEHWAHGPQWQTYTLQGDSWFGFDCTAPLAIDGVEIRLVPLVGHTPGHCAVVVRTGDRWLVHCGDGYHYHGYIDPERPHLPPGGWLVKALVAPFEVFRAVFRHAGRLRRLVREHGDVVQPFCSHDPHEFDARATANPI